MKTINVQYPTCESCQFWAKLGLQDKLSGPNDFGQCTYCAMHYAKGKLPFLEDIESSCVVIEFNKGWGAYFGKDFGCVHHEPK